MIDSTIAFEIALSMELFDPYTNPDAWWLTILVIGLFAVAIYVWYERQSGHNGDSQR